MKCARSNTTNHRPKTIDHNSSFSFHLILRHEHFQGTQPSIRVIAYTEPQLICKLSNISILQPKKNYRNPLWKRKYQERSLDDHAWWYLNNTNVHLFQRYSLQECKLKFNWVFHTQVPILRNICYAPPLNKSTFSIITQFLGKEPLHFPRSAESGVDQVHPEWFAT